MEEVGEVAEAAHLGAGPRLVAVVDRATGLREGLLDDVEEELLALALVVVPRLYEARRQALLQVALVVPVQRNYLLDRALDIVLTPNAHHALRGKEESFPHRVRVGIGHHKAAKLTVQQLLGADSCASARPSNPQS